MKEMIQKNKGRLICSAFVMCVGIILGYTFENSLWINGTFAVTYVVIMAVTFYDNRNRQQSDKVIRMVTWIVPGMTLLYNGIARWIELNSHPSFPFCKRVSHFESDLQILYPTFHFCNDFPVFFLAFMI